MLDQRRFMSHLKSDSQTLITGVYRSGTEYITQLINMHPDISATMYRVNVLRFIYRKFDPIHRRENYYRAVEAVAERIQSRYGMELNREQVLSALDETGPVTCGTIYDAVMCSLYLAGSGVKHWAEKVQLLWREIPEFLEMMPNGKAILVLRDPRGVLCSFKLFTHAPEPAYLGAVFNCLDCMQRALSYRDTLPPDRILVVRYEDVVAEPEESMRKIWAFTGLDMLKPVDFADFSGAKDAYGNAWKSNSSIQPDTAAARFEFGKSRDAWKDRLSEDDLSLLHAVCGPVMVKWGYAWETVPAKKPDFNVFRSDGRLARMYEQWLQDGTGAQAFPQDPLDPSTWNRKRTVPTA